ncbi:hypothetical protein CCR85_02180 [Rhodothalassium salexigens]|uniref:SDR family NAD(P)-dependent oxidoreductase n=1 Tax=Rhodothalassium salexigens TaxID=1086 RepID=UPI0019133105|nr:SDR family oxidoreductase [Rhodothalassium salexigens]MBK5910297.1 hypothetical protein [Rhodothalassium salexigens]MBK5921090.1 hypothetical protein [Rhodothalassium salexigens]
MTAAPPSALVTGIAGGIGQAIGRALSAAGYAVLGIDRPGVPAPAADVCARFLNLDLARLAADPVAAPEAQALAQALDAAPPALLVNNAAVQHLGAVDALDWAQVQETLAVNLAAPVALVRAALPGLRAARGTVINITSVHARATKPGFWAYATSKAALDGLTAALAVELGPDVRVVALAPAAVATEMLEAGFAGRADARAALAHAHPAGRIARPHEVADAVVWLASAAAGFITGSTLSLDGGVLARLHDPA